LIIRRTIDKLLPNRIRFRPPVSGSKRALLSYQRIPPFSCDAYYRSSHNNKLTARCLVDGLLSSGYSVDVYDCLDEDIKNLEQYDLFLGHSSKFRNIADRLSPRCRKILFVTGSNPSFGNEQQYQRSKEVFERRSISILPYVDNLVSDSRKNFEAADVILLLGNEFVKDTYDRVFHPKIRLINNVALFDWRRKEAGRPSRNFIFLSSVGQVHRGLDLVLEVFAKRSERLYVLSDFAAETEFVAAYRKELFQTKNIVPVGFVSTNSRRFRNLVDDVTFGVLPSCSEGQSSSVLNLMALGVIPIVTRNTGVNVAPFGVNISGLTPQTVERAVGVAANLSILEIEERRAAMFLESTKYSRQTFIDGVQQIVSRTAAQKTVPIPGRA
jgi:hypothetical protein